MVVARGEVVEEIDEGVQWYKLPVNKISLGDVMYIIVTVVNNTVYYCILILLFLLEICIISPRVTGL